MEIKLLGAQLKYKRTCFKIWYESRKEAKHALKWLNKKEIPNKKLQDVYFCAECNRWHLTSIDKEFTRDILRKKRKS